MVDLSRSTTSSPDVHAVPSDPGISWIKDEAPTIEAPPDNDPDPLPEAKWASNAKRTGICGAVAPRVVKLPDASYRMYYTQMVPRPGHPAGANDYDNVSTRILSATSTDGLSWTPEAGVRLTPHQGGAGAWRVVSSEVVPTSDGRLRMYYECAPGTQSDPSTIRSAVSKDGLFWEMEGGNRLASGDANYSSPRILCLQDGRIRLYCHERGRGIISAISQEGLTFTEEEGTRISKGGPYDTTTAFACEILQLHTGEYVMYYAGYSAPNRAQILRALSDDGLHWEKQAEPAVLPGDPLDRAKSSEMCLYRLPTGQAYRIVYEGCDGTAVDERGVWRILGATARA
tara:strand:- start:2576 stop:3601 length:1026 start_codon:yes stop_codon:yes gene_type:complete